MKIHFNDSLAQRLYQDFCEAEGGVDHPVLEAWCERENVFGEINAGEKTACIDNLFFEAIRYVIDALELEGDAY